MKKKSPPWPRWAKTMRNMILFLLLALIIWTQLGEPLPYGSAVRRKARQYLMPELEHCTDISRGFWGGDIRVDYTEGAAMLSVPARPYNIDFIYYPLAEPYRLTEGTNLLFSPWTTLLPGDGPNVAELHAVYITLYPPEGSETARLTLHNAEGTYTAEAEKEEGIFVFFIKPEPDADGGTGIGPSWYREYTCELEIFNGDGDRISS